ncbi:MAG: SDR family oxidoreductase [Flavobacteriales bacterium]|nr:MAG: SDR family oxidoreductase [Flavobacteriales bacterium TMED96]RZP12309.1 MAG: SDR family oxidoreductase [Flavobacteriales bacterium]|tara:strand:- start:21 stop:716 length:696 start_codon:yes stop_codon:yes gene_type:complete
MKNYLVIGGSSGIGKEISELLSNENIVFSTSRNELNESNENIRHIKYDVLVDELDPELLPEQIDGFVYCPGTINLRPFRSLKLETFRSDLELNLIGAIKTLQIILTRLQQSPSSSIIFYSTVAVKTGMPFHSSVSSSKSALEGLTKSLAAEFAPKIRVNCIAPSIVNTPLANKFLNTEDKIEKAAARHPLNKIGTAKEIAQLTQYLLDDKSKWITGQIINIDGGISSVKVN